MARATPAAPATPAPPCSPRLRRARHLVATASVPAAPGAVERTPREDRPVYASVYEWLRARLPRASSPKPAVKRLAVLISGLLVSEPCTLGALASAVEGLALSPASDESIARRLRRLLAEDDRLDPTQVLPALFATVLPELLRDVVARHAASAHRAAGAPGAKGKGKGKGKGGHRADAPLVRVVVDDSSQGPHVHLLVAGLAYRGLVLPLAVRTWAQNAPLPEDQYWTELQGLLVADRAFGVPRLLDLANALGWQWLLRVQGQTRVLLRDGTIRPVRRLVPRPGTTWFGGFAPGAPPARPAPSDGPAAPGAFEAVAVFKAAGWRASQVVAAWAPGAAEPWLLVTSVRPTPERLLDDAQRWAIERLFLCWKSHGWDLEACGVHDPVRLGAWSVDSSSPRCGRSPPAPSTPPPVWRPCAPAPPGAHAGTAGPPRRRARPRRPGNSSPVSG